MQSASSKIWTRVAVSISYDDNHYPTGTSKFPISLFMVEELGSIELRCRIVEFTQNLQQTEIISSKRKEN